MVKNQKRLERFSPALRGKLPAPQFKNSRLSGGRAGYFICLWCLAILAFQPLIMGSQPIEGLQRSVQQRWGIVSPGNAAFPPRSDGATPGAFPPDGFYGADLEDGGSLESLVEDLESKVFSLSYAYSTVSTMDGSSLYMGGSAGGGWIFDTVSVPKVAAVFSTLPASADIQSRVDRIKQLLAMMKNAPIRTHPFLLNADGTTTQFSFQKSAMVDSPPALGSGYNAAAAQWQNAAPLAINAFDRDQSGDLFYAFSFDVLQGFGTHDVESLIGYMGNLAADVGNANGALDFYLEVAANATLGGTPVAPDGLWHLFGTKSGSHQLISEKIGFDVPPYVNGRGTWVVQFAGGMFRGSFTDDWNPQGCRSCQSGRCVTPSLGSINFSISLGGGNFGLSASGISLTSGVPGRAEPGALTFTLASGDEVIRVNGAPAQFATASTLAQITVLNGNKYQISEYPAPTQPKQADGTYPVSGTASKVTTIENPLDLQTNKVDLNTMKITVENGTRSDIYSYNYTPATGAWKLSKGDGASVEVLTPVWNADHTERTELRQVFDAGGVLKSETQSVYHDYSWGEGLISQVEDPAGAALTTSYSYYNVSPQTDPTQTGKYGHLRQKVDSNGSWTTYDYDQYSRPIKQVSQFGDSAPGSADGTNRVLTTSYAAANPTVTQVETLLGAETRRHYSAYFLTETREIDCTAPGAAWDDASNSVTITKTVSGGIFSGKVQSVQNPDGTMTIYGYQQAGDGSTRTTTVSAGQPNAGRNAIVDGTQTITVVDKGGNQLSQMVVDISSGLTLSTATRTGADEFGRPTQITYDDGTTMSDQIGCCGPQTITDRTGAVTAYVYDALGNPSSVTSDGIAALTQYDALSRPVMTQRQGTDGTVQTLSQTKYDLAGRIVEARDVFNQITSISEVFDNSHHRVRTTVNPDGSTRIETYQQDGQLLSISGTAVHPVQYQYGVEDITPPGGSLVHAPFRKEIRIGANGAVTEWTKTYQDMGDRVCEVLQSNGGATYSSYNSLGQLVKAVDPDGVTMLYTYNGRGEPEVSALNLNRDGVIAYGGSDRITKTLRSVLSANGGVVQRTTTQQWNQNGQDSSITASQVDSTPNGRHIWSSSYGLTTESQTTLNGDGGTTTTTTFPDGSTAVEQRDHDRITSSVRTAAGGGGQISGTAYTYGDPFHRLMQTVDARNGGTLYSYYVDDQLQSVTTPAPGDGSAAQTTTYYYEPKTGRKQREQQPDGGVVHYEYWPTGELKKTYGAQTYPVEYSYDTQGRPLTLTTHGAAGAAVTTWNYNPVSGFLVSKQYADGAGPSYTMTLAGRMASRTWARGAATAYDHNNAGEVTGIGYSGTVTPSVGLNYDRRGILVTATDGAGTRSIAPTIDGQMGSESYAGGLFDGVTINRSYDPLLRRQGLTLAVGGSNFATTYGYDGASRLKTVTGAGVTATYGYVANSSLVGQVAFANGGQSVMTTSQGYDNLNRLSSIGSVIANQATSVSGVGYAYDAANERVRANMADGGNWNYGYDPLGQVVSGSKRWANGQAVVGQQYGYQFDNIGNRTAATTNGRVSTYSPNALNQYASRTVPGTVDILGTAKAEAKVAVNGSAADRQGTYFAKTVAVDNSQGPAYSSISVNAVDSTGVGGQSISALKSGSEFVPQTPEQFSYDADGNLTGDGRWIYTWDGENRLISMVAKANVPAAARYQLTFAYDGFGRRIQKTVSTWDVATGSYVVSKVLRFVYDGWNLLAELNGNNQPLRSYVWGLDLSGSLQGAGGVGGLLLETDVAAQKAYIPTFDGNGNVLTLVAALDGSVAIQYEYGPFGEPLRATGQMAQSNPFRFSTHYSDNEAGLIYAKRRYYTAETGRWLTRDPLEEDGGVNLSAYVYNDPQNDFDPLGESDTITFEKTLKGVLGGVGAYYFDVKDGDVSYKFTVALRAANKGGSACCLETDYGFGFGGTTFAPPECTNARKSQTFSLWQVGPSLSKKGASVKMKVSQTVAVDLSVVSRPVSPVFQDFPNGDRSVLNPNPSIRAVPSANIHDWKYYDVTLNVLTTLEGKVTTAFDATASASVKQVQWRKTLWETRSQDYSVANTSLGAQIISAPTKRVRVNCQTGEIQEIGSGASNK